MNSKRLMGAAAVSVMAFGLAACSGGGAGSPEESSTPGTSATGGGGEMTDITVGVAMPTQTSERWIADGEAVQAGLEELGYSVDLQFANDDIPTQTQQIDSMITNGADYLIIASIDGTAISAQLQTAADNGIPVIAYDRLIRESENVDFYVTFDNYQVGVQQATSLLVGLGVWDMDGNETGETGPFNVELFAGSLDDNNAYFFWNGAIDTLQPYLDNGTLVVPSGQTDIEQAAILRWQQATAQERMDNLLSANYVGTDATVDGVLSPYDGLSRGIITSLQNAGYDGTVGDGFPAVTGQDAEIASVKLIADGVQFASIFKDTRKLAAQAVTAVQEFVEGGAPTANDTETYENGVKIVPSYLLESDIVYADNIQSLLVDSGYWTAEEVASGVAE